MRELGQAKSVVGRWLNGVLREHMTPGVLYLLGAPPQLSQRIRTKHYTVHRRLGRVLITAALLSMLFAFLFGLRFPWGGSVEAVATAVFGCWFLICLLLAVRAIRRGDMVNHRRWMIRAFATCVAIGTVRIWIGLLIASGLLDFHDSFAAAFWIAFSLHVIAGEWWVPSRAWTTSPQATEECRPPTHRTASWPISSASTLTSQGSRAKAA